MAKGSAATEMELALARSLYRADKWDPARDATLPFDWNSLRGGYLVKSKRLMRTFEKDGLALMKDPASTSDQS